MGTSGEGRARAAPMLRDDLREDGEVSSGPDEGVPGGILSSHNTEKATKMCRVPDYSSFKSNSAPKKRLPVWCRSVGKYQIPCKAVNSRKSWPNNMVNDNLVIRFSDDSDSDSDKLNEEELRMRTCSTDKADSDKMPITMQETHTRSVRASVHSRLGPCPRGKEAATSFSNESNAILPAASLPWKDPCSQQQFDMFTTSTNRLDGNKGMISVDHELESMHQEMNIRENKMKDQKRFMVPIEEDHEEFCRKRTEVPIYGPLDATELGSSGRLAKRFKYDTSILNHSPQCRAPTMTNAARKYNEQPIEKDGGTKNQGANSCCSIDSGKNLVGTILGSGEHQHKVVDIAPSALNTVLHPSIVSDRLIVADLSNDSSQGDVHCLKENTTLQSIMEVEELYDKELEQAQADRHKCEVEERKALKAYRKAQIALIEANERCGSLQRKRELATSRIHEFMMEKSSTMLPSDCHNSRDCNKMLSLPNHLPVSEHVVLEKQDQAPTDQSLDEAMCAPIGRGAAYLSLDCANNVCAVKPSNVSPEDNAKDNCSLNDAISEPTCQMAHLNDMSNVNASFSDGELDFELLEASLRSRLVQRLGNRPPSKCGEVSITDCEATKTTKFDVQMLPSTSPNDQHIAELGNVLTNDRGSKVSEVENANAAVETCANPDLCSGLLKNDTNLVVEQDNQSASLDDVAGPLDETFVQPLTASIIPSSLPQIASRHSKWLLCSLTRECVLTAPDATPDLVNRSDHESSTAILDACNASERLIVSSWPFCMFELRGKCNDEECQCQHAEVCNWRNSKEANQIVNSASGQISCNISGHLLPIPTYRIGPYLIKSDSNLIQPVLAGTIWQYWQRGFCASFPLPLSVQRILPSDALLYRSADDLDADQSRSMRLLFIRNHDNRVKKVVQGFPESEQSLELAINFYFGKQNKPDRLEALSLLARAIENDPKSVVLWSVYLHIYYQKDESTKKDDMFSEAVQHNPYSYELWLMHINSRLQFNDRLDAYQDALSMLCQMTATCEQESFYKSASALDIVLQMIHFMSMSGNIERALSWVYAHVTAEAAAAGTGNMALNDALSCLVTSDKCIFWICCLYTSIYGILPLDIQEKFELEKDFPFGMKWPAINLGSDKLIRVKDLLKYVCNKVATNIGEDASDGISLRSSHFLAVSHINCVCVLDGLDAAAELLLKYMRLYPTCYELFLIFARWEDTIGTLTGFSSFADVLMNWPREVPGVHYLWNQYAEHYLAKGERDGAEKIMTEWFQAHVETEDDHCSSPSPSGMQVAAATSSSSVRESLPACLQDYSTCHFDRIFWLLNLSLHRMLQRNLSGARHAVNEVLKLDSPEYYEHCLKEHAALQLFDKSSFRETSQVILQIMCSHLGDCRVLPVKEPMSRRYCRDIKRPRVRQMIDCILGPVSFGFSVVNSLLEVCFGPSLLPEKVEVKDLVDFVESCLEICPANYRLALSVCILVTKHFTGGGVSSEGIRFWASSVLVNSIFQAIPVAPEFVWIEAAQLLLELQSVELCRRFHQQAVSVYPFSLKLWTAYIKLSKTTGSGESIVESAMQRGLELVSCGMTVHL